MERKLENEARAEAIAHEHIYPGLITDFYKGDYKRISNAVDLEGKTVLEVAGGMGFLSALIAMNHPDSMVHSTDYSHASVRKGIEELTDVDENPSNLSFSVQDAYNLALPDKSFDIVICDQSLHHLVEPEKAIEEMVRVAKDKVHIYDFRRDFDPYVAKNMQVHSHGLITASMEASLSKAEYLDMADNLGLPRDGLTFTKDQYKVPFVRWIIDAK